MGRAEAHTPVAKKQATAAAAKKKMKSETAADAASTTSTLSGAELWRAVRVSEAVAQLPLATAGGNLVESEAFKTPQQLNAQRQNARRAREKAALKEAQERAAAAVEGAAAQTKGVPAVGGRTADPPRLLDTVAEFWARKKARLAGSACSAEGKGP